jgi:uncharacterized membrane protein (UPF0127 family)
VRRWVLAVVLVIAACGGDDPPAASDGGAAETSTADGSPSTPGTGSPGTTSDLDGEEPDGVEPPPSDGVPVSAQPEADSTRTVLPGFGEVVVQVRRVDGDTVEWCLLLAETPAQTQRGLMEVADPDLGGYDGMLFRFIDDNEGGFYMRNTAMPLEIAYLDEGGEVVSSTTMEPCPDSAGCPTYPADGPYRRTVEVPVAAGGLDRLGITAGASVVDTGHTC